MAKTTAIPNTKPDYPRGVTFEEVWAGIKERKIQGAIAGAIFGSEEKKAVIEAGLFVIEQSGDTMKIKVPQDFVPREF